jgi:hypothetical protein
MRGEGGRFKFRFRFRFRRFRFRQSCFNHKISEDTSHLQEFKTMNPELAKCGASKFQPWLSYLPFSMFHRSIAYFSTVQYFSQRFDSSTWRRNFPISVKVDPSEKHRKFPIFSKLSDISNGDPSENRVKFSITSKFSDICAGGSVGKW